MRVVRAMSTRGESGASAVEFALVSLILFPLLFGILQYGYYFFALQNGNSVAREAARKVSVGDCSSNTALETYVDTRLAGVERRNLDVGREYLDASGLATTTPAVGGSVKVTVTFNTLDLGLVPVPGDGLVTKTAETRVEDLMPGTC